MTSEAPELLPCPFCGNSNPYTDDESCRIFGRRTGHNYAVACSNCEVSSLGSETLSEAITAWNTRANQQALDAAREEGRRMGLEEAAKWVKAGPDLPDRSHLRQSDFNKLSEEILTLIGKPADPVAEAARVILSGEMTNIAAIVLNAVESEKTKWEESQTVRQGHVPPETITLAMFEACLRAIAQKEGE